VGLPPLGGVVAGVPGLATRRLCLLRVVGTGRGGDLPRGVSSQAVAARSPAGRACDAGGLRAIPPLDAVARAPARADGAGACKTAFEGCCRVLSSRGARHACRFPLAKTRVRPVKRTRSPTSSTSRRPPRVESCRAANVVPNRGAHHTASAHQAEPVTGFSSIPHWGANIRQTTSRAPVPAEGHHETRRNERRLCAAYPSA
jgi:hypothetical protein